MNKSHLKLILLDYSYYDYIEEFQSYYVYNKLFANWRLIEKFVNNRKLKITNLQSLMFYMNLLNFGSFCDWKIVSTSIKDPIINLVYSKFNKKHTNIDWGYYSHDLKIFRFEINTIFSSIDMLFHESDWSWPMFNEVNTMKYRNNHNYNIIYREI